MGGRILEVQEVRPQGARQDTSAVAAVRAGPRLEMVSLEVTWLHPRQGLPQVQASEGKVADTVHQELEVAAQVSQGRLHTAEVLLHREHPEEFWKHLQTPY